MYGQPTGCPLSFVSLLYHYFSRFSSMTEAQKRFNRACEALAEVRRLSSPKVLINVAAEGGQQVNVA
jgi:hypothetical protein